MKDFASRHYFERRAEEERAAAERAMDERAAQCHRELAGYYGTLAAGTRQVPPDDPAERSASILARDFWIVP